VDVKQVQAACGWPLKIATALKITPAPAESTLHLLREKLDPQKLYL
jgi:glutaconate CoA-transferase subunit B